MGGESDKPEPIRLNVLPNSNKVEQLKAQGNGNSALSAQDPVAGSGESYHPNPNPSTPAFGGHVNRTAPSPQGKTVEQKLLEGKIIAACKSVYDPEIPVDIYELGLIYDIEINPENEVFIRMTLTAPACPVAGILPGQVEQKIEQIPEVKSCKVELVWDPPWSRDMMSEAALLQLGMC